MSGKIGKIFRNTFLRQRGLATIPLMIALLLMAIAIPVATRLVQENQNPQNRAAGTTCCCGGTINGVCTSGYSEGCCAAYPTTAPPTTAPPTTAPPTSRPPTSAPPTSRPTCAYCDCNCQCSGNSSCITACQGSCRPTAVPTVAPTTVPTSRPTCAYCDCNCQCSGNSSCITACQGSCRPTAVPTVASCIETCSTGGTGNRCCGAGEVCNTYFHFCYVPGVSPTSAGVCTPGVCSCKDSGVQCCNSAGSGYNYASCNSGMHCESGQCKDDLQIGCQGFGNAACSQKCTPPLTSHGQSGCQSGYVCCENKVIAVPCPYSCVGTGYCKGSTTSDQCPGGDDLKCCNGEVRECLDGEKGCQRIGSGAQSRICSNGTWGSWTSCGANSTCNGDVCGGMAPVEKVCTGGVCECVGSGAVRCCKSDGTGWNSANCAEGTTCSNGMCNALIPTITPTPTIGGSGPTSGISPTPVRPCDCRNNPAAKAIGDANCDNSVDIYDVSIWRSESIDQAGTTTNKTTWKADFDCNGFVNNDDRDNIWLINYAKYLPIVTNFLSEKESNTSGGGISGNIDITVNFCLSKAMCKTGYFCNFGFCTREGTIFCMSKEQCPSDSFCNWGACKKY